MESEAKEGETEREQAGSVRAFRLCPGTYTLLRTPISCFFFLPAPGVTASFCEGVEHLHGRPRAPFACPSQVRGNLLSSSSLIPPLLRHGKHTPIVKSLPVVCTGQHAPGSSPHDEGTPLFAPRSYTRRSPTAWPACTRLKSSSGGAGTVQIRLRRCPSASGSKVLKRAVSPALLLVERTPPTSPNECVPRRSDRIKLAGIADFPLPPPADAEASPRSPPPKVRAADRRPTCSPPKKP
ncbi:hypothetical protein BJY59DRAFT_400068 [Rhodotorula toruloides]